jgi:hypothetical protein
MLLVLLPSWTCMATSLSSNGFSVLCLCIVYTQGLWWLYEKGKKQSKQEQGTRKHLRKQTKKRRKGIPKERTRTTNNDKNFWEELIAFFPLIGYGPHRKRCIHQSIQCSPQPTSKRPNSKPHGGTRQQAIAKTPAEWSANQILGVIVVFVTPVLRFILSHSQKPQEALNLLL